MKLQPHRFESFSLILTLLLSTVVWGFDVNGPYQNGQTCVAYSHPYNGSSSLYAVNEVTQPYESWPGIGEVKLFNKQDNPSTPWQVHPFLNMTGTPFPFSSFPSLLGPNSAPFGLDQLNVTAMCNVVDNIVSRRVGCSFMPGGSGNHFQGFATSAQAGDSRRLVVSRTNPQIQWLGTSNTDATNHRAFLRTSDGWQTSVVLTADEFEEGNSVYGLAIDDNPNAVNVAVATLANETCSNVYTERPIACKRFTYTTNGGQSWQSVQLETLFPGQTNFYNMQVAMTPDLEQSADHYLYLLGATNVADGYVCAWAKLLSNGTLVWHNSTADQFARGTEFLPFFPMDLSVEHRPDGAGYSLMATTTDGIYYAAHNAIDDNIPWTRCVEGPATGLRTEGFHNIAVNPIDRGRSYAVAGSFCSYYTLDYGSTWTPMYNPGLMHIEPMSAVMQYGTGHMLALYVDKIRSRCNPPTNTNSGFGLCIQQAPHQSSFSAGTGFEPTVQLGWTRNNTSQNGSGLIAQPMMDVSPIDGRFYVAYMDQAIQTHNNHSLGVAVHSDDDGLTWTPGEFPGWDFTHILDGQSLYPQPSSLVADPNLASVAYLAFKKIDVNLRPVAPPFVYTNDGGHTWTTPENEGLLHIEMPRTLFGQRRIVAAGRQNGTSLVYLLYSVGSLEGTNMLHVTQDIGENWTEITLPQNLQTGTIIINIACQPQNANHIEISTTTGASRSLDGGQTWEWHEIVTFDETINLVPEKYDPDFNLFWAETGSRFHKRMLSLIRMDVTGEHMFALNYWDSDPLLNPELCNLYIEQVPNQRMRRAIWSAWSKQPGIAWNDYTNRPTVKVLEYNILDDAIAQSMTVTESPVYIASNTTVMPGATLTFAPGVTILFLPGANLSIEGNLVAQGTSGQPVEFKSAVDADGATFPWGQIHVSLTGSAHLSYCDVSGATTGLYTEKALALTVDHCTFHDNAVGIFTYAPAGFGKPEFTYCTMTNNTSDGISLLSTPSATISSCQISDNGGNGITLSSSSPAIDHCEFTANGNYGIYCYSSSPTLFCNNFHDDGNGEMYILNGYPILWSSNGTDAGSNTFVATDKTLITMTNGYPIVANGLNKFTIYGSRGYFMADLSSKVPNHSVYGNEWSPTPPPVTAFLPNNDMYQKPWYYSPTDAYGNCEAPKGTGSNAAMTSFETGFAAEMAGNTTEAQTIYEATISQYPDSIWAEVAAVRLLNTQQQLDSNYSTLESYYQTVASTYASDTSLVETVLDLATRTLVEDNQFDPALNTYEQLMYAATDPIDSACAAIDYAVTALRQQYEDSTDDGLDSYLPRASVASVMSAMRQIQDVLPKAPEASHENFTPPPANFVLEQNYPNPFNPVTTIRYYLPQGSDIRLDVFNLMGQKVATLTTGYQDNGYHNVSWNAQGFASGVYVYQLRAGNSIQTQKMLLLK